MRSSFLLGNTSRMALGRALSLILASQFEDTLRSHFHSGGKTTAFDFDPAPFIFDPPRSGRRRMRSLQYRKKGPGRRHRSGTPAKPMVMEKVNDEARFIGGYMHSAEARRFIAAMPEEQAAGLIRMREAYQSDPSSHTYRRQLAGARRAGRAAQGQKPDFYRQEAARLFAVPYEKVNEEQRRAAKDWCYRAAYGVEGLAASFTKLGGTAGLAAANLAEFEARVVAHFGMPGNHFRAGPWSGRFYQTGGTVTGRLPSST